MHKDFLARAARKKRYNVLRGANFARIMTRLYYTFRYIIAAERKRESLINDFGNDAIGSA